MKDEVQGAVAAAIAEASDGGLRVVGGGACERVGGGCINEAWRLRAEGESDAVFVKTNAASKLDMFAAEATALSELAASETIRVPRPICHGTVAGEAFLALQWIDLGGRGDEAEMGRQVAALHRVESADGRYGWHRDNVIGETPQRNDWCEDWAEFFVERRLRPQFRMAADGGRRFVDDERLMKRAGELLAEHRPMASLLHGDLWGGNASFAAQDGAPVLFDPATYYGDRETDLAFSTLFGGFGAGFYRSYEELSPHAPGQAERLPLYNLYHVLNHYNLFGGGYAAQAEGMISRLLAGC